jgi:glutamate racemase
MQVNEGRERPLGVFDSGFGGLSIVQAIADLLPHESMVYIGDSARYPYGPRASSEVRAFAVELGDILVERFDVKVLIVACNTASATALTALSDRYEVPVIGVIDAGVRAAKAVSTRAKIGVMATVGTVASGAYQESFLRSGGSEELAFQACPGLVEFVERGELNSEEVMILLRLLLEPLMEAKVDTLLLACTHFPFLARAISDVVGHEVVLVSTAEETAFEVNDVLHQSGLLCGGPEQGSIRYFSTGDPAAFARVGSTLTGMAIDTVGHLEVGTLDTCRGKDQMDD